MHPEPHTLIEHPEPITGERAVEAWTYIDPSYGSGWEKLFVAPEGPRTWRVCNIPHHVYGLKVGSVVTVDNSGRIAMVLSTPEAPAYRLRLGRPSDRDAFLAAIGDAWVEPMYSAFVGVQAREGEDATAFAALIDVMVAAGIVVDAEDVDGQAFDPGPVARTAAPEGTGPRVHDPGYSRRHA